jgi:TfoX/Sxy family transcriptional regulator of competence genes
MAIDEELRQEVREHLAGMRDIEEKPMVGGMGFMWRGNLLCGVMGQDLLVRVAEADYDRFIGEEGASPMVMGGRTGKRWIRVSRSIGSRRPAMEEWIDRAREYVGTLPPK